MRTRLHLSGLYLVFTLTACGENGGIPQAHLTAEETEFVLSRTTPLSSLDSDDESVNAEELRVLNEMASQARLVALGDASYGARESFLFKKRIFTHWATGAGFRALLLQSGFCNSFAINEYVLHGTGTAGEALAAQSAWPWQAREMLTLVNWMRTFNLGKTPENQLWFAGVDPRNPEKCMDHVLHYINPFAPEEAEQIAQYLQSYRPYLLDLRTLETYQKQPEATRREIRTQLNAALETLIRKRTELTEKTSHSAFELALQSLRIVLDHEAIFGALNNTETAWHFHAESFTRTTQWWLEQMGPNSKAVLWAHNRYTGLLDEPGKLLRASLGEAYRSVSFTFHSGVISAKPHPTASPSPMLAAPAYYDSYEAGFHTTGVQQGILDLRLITADTPGTQWLLGPRLARDIADTFYNDWFEYVSIPLPNTYDALVYFDRVAATTFN